MATSVSNDKQLGFISALPNPAAIAVNLEYDLLDAIPFAVQLLDITGKVILKENTSSERKNNLYLDISTINNGIYICQLLTDKGAVSRKIVKQ